MRAVGLYTHGDPEVLQMVRHCFTQPVEPCLKKLPVAYVTVLPNRN